MQVSKACVEDQELARGRGRGAEWRSGDRGKTNAASLGATPPQAGRADKEAANCRTAS